MRADGDPGYLLSYLSEYYDALTEENRVIGDFLLEASSMTKGARILDVGCGPTFFYWALFHPYASSVSGVDLRSESVRYAHAEVLRAAAGIPRPKYLDVASHVLARTGIGHVDPLAYVRRRAGRVGVIHQADLLTPWTLDADFNLVVSTFGIDCLVHTREEMRFCLGEALRILEPGGRLALVTLCGTDSWYCGGVPIECLRTTPKTVEADLLQVGFRIEGIREIQAVTARERGQGYEKMLFCSAVSPSR